MTDCKPGSRWKSGVCGGEFVVVRPPAGEGTLTCGGVPMRAQTDTGPLVEAVESAGEGTMVGKRYADAESGVELLCTKPGSGALAFAGRPLARKDAKPLPASD